MTGTAWTDDPATLLRVTSDVVLSEIDTAGSPGFRGSKAAARQELATNLRELGELQERLWAESRSGGRRRILLVLQAMDTAGKGGIVRHVVGGVDPQGVRIHAFKAPTEEERANDFLWRIRRELPEPGIIGVFDRSHYEDVLIHRVRALSTAAEIERRYERIVEFERDLVADGTTVIKVMLHISKREQKDRLTERLDRPDKHWKFSPGDVDERMLWDDYMRAYEIALARTSTDDAPWFVVPADRKWYARIAVQQLVLGALRRLDPQWPAATFDVEEQRRRLAAT
jgi:PPK2 family polyphosphate:nucleotide phosphotransferase